ncbi:MAG TPA: AtpZ/AtpI family protein [Turneriella sp.]|nr:AtpZ/AtpI family protein [Turneriella sp.]
MDQKQLKEELAALKAQEKKVRAAVGKEKNPAEEAIRSPNGIRYTWLGLEFATTFLVFVWGGSWLDGKWGVSPWLTLGGLLVGFSIAIYRLITVARTLSA